MSSNNPMVQVQPPIDDDELIRRVKANDRRHKEIAISLLDEYNEVSKRLIKALRTNTVVTSVKVVIGMRNKNIIQSFVSLFATNHTVKHLHVSVRYFEQQAILIFLGELSQLPMIALESLALPEIQSRTIAQQVATLLSQNHPSLTHLQFDYLAQDESLIVIVMEAVHRNEHMVSLELGASLYSNDQIEALLPEGNRIKRISLTIDSEEAQTGLWRTFHRGHCGNLTSFDLTLLDGTGGIQRSIETLVTLPSLQDLALRLTCYHEFIQAERELLHQVLQDIGVPNLNLRFFVDFSMTSSLPFMAPVPPNVRKLLLSVDQIRDDSVDAEDTADMNATVFRDNSTLEFLTLQGNQLINDVVVAFASILPTMTGLTYLSLDCQQVHHVGGTALLRAVKASPNLLQVDLENWREFGYGFGIPANIVDENFYTCKLRSIRYTELIANAPLSLYPRALSKLGKGKWFNVAFPVMRARCGELIPSGKESGGGGSGKRKRDDSS